MLKPNPSLVGASRHPQPPLWAISERDILNWWLTTRETAVTITNTALGLNLQDSPLLHAEKEALEWWHAMREML